MSNEAAPGWDNFLAEFHAARPGITEQVLASSRDARGQTPYEWLKQRLPEHGLIVDVACGSAPLWTERLAGRYLGVDVSAAEISAARARGVERVAIASATALPVPDRAASAVVCSMALMILPNLAQALAEAARVMQDDAVLLAIVPGTPRGIADLALSAGLLRAAGGRLGYRNDATLRRISPVLAAAGLAVREDSTQTYRFDLADPEAPDLLAKSLYLRGAQAAHEAAIAQFLARQAAHGRSMPVPIRRLVIGRHSGGSPRPSDASAAGETGAP